MSRIGPQTTPLEPAYAQPRAVITPGIDLTLDFTAQVEQLAAPVSSVVVSLTVMCPARFLAVFSGYFFSKS